MAKRFIVKEEDIKYIDIKEGIFEIRSKEVKHIQVLRHNVGEEIVINQYICKILKMTKDTIVCEKINYAPERGVPSVNLTLYCAMLKSDKMDYVIQKATELGVKNIVPYISQNVIVKLDEKAKQKRVEKFRVISQEACKQCGRTDTVNISNIITFGELNEIIEKNYEEPYIFAYENEKKSLKEALNSIQDVNNISVIIGPEGGFDPKEAKRLVNNKNVVSISLGDRILKAETAALGLVAIVMYEKDM